MVGPEEGPGVQITVGCKLPSVVLGTELKSFKSTASSTIAPSLQLLLITFTCVWQDFFFFNLQRIIYILLNFYSLNALTSLPLLFFSKK